MELTIAKLPLANDLDEFDLTGMPIDQMLLRALTTAAIHPSPQSR